MSTSIRASSTVLKILIHYPPEYVCVGDVCTGTTSRRSNTRLTFQPTNQRPGGIIERHLPTGPVEVDRSG